MFGLLERIKPQAAAGPVDPRQLWSSMAGREWAPRARIAADWLAGCESVVDIGCGAMTLERLLPAGVRYIPVDVVRRDDRTTVVDLNQQPLPALEADAANMLGVMEYLNDPAAVLRQLRRYRRVVLSYNARHILRNRAHPWVNNFSVRELRSLIEAAGFTIAEQRRIRLSESIYRLD